MTINKVKQVHDFGQSIWLDFIDRKIIHTGELKKLIEEDGVRGITSNPAIFEKAINSSPDYNEDISKLAKESKSNDAIFYGLAIRDIQAAADLLKPVYEEKVKGSDGYVSLEVSPHLALDTDGTVKQALELWKAVNRENVMIKIPGTEPGLPAIRTAIKEGLNINVTLLFGLERYEAVTDAFLSGLEDRVAAGKSIDHTASVASFFLSRIDVMIDPLLDEKGLGDLKGKVAIASAKKAYEIYKRVFSSDRWNKLAAKGASPQRLLWASTGTKNPAYKDTMYVEALIGADTVNTVPMETLEAYRDHGQPASRLEDDLAGATEVLAKLKSGGIDKFNKPYDKLLETIEKQKNKIQ
jgi:transaldolase/transaldolase/glucose-6-phosphate isomerase